MYVCVSVCEYVYVCVSVCVCVCVYKVQKEVGTEQLM